MDLDSASVSLLILLLEGALPGTGTHTSCEFLAVNRTVAFYAETGKKMASSLSTFPVFWIIA